jgi:hypothetical protein
MGLREQLERAGVDPCPRFGAAEPVTINQDVTKSRVTINQGASVSGGDGGHKPVLAVRHDNAPLIQAPTKRGRPKSDAPAMTAAERKRVSRERKKAGSLGVDDR